MWVSSCLQPGRRRISQEDVVLPERPARSSVRGDNGLLLNPQADRIVTRR